MEEEEVTGRGRKVTSEDKEKMERDNRDKEYIMEIRKSKNK